MADYKSFANFKTAFSKKVNGYNDDLVVFETPDKLSGGLFLCFILDGKIKRCHMYCTDYHIELWKTHFEEYFNTGKFDFNCYYEIYCELPEEMNPVDVGLKFKFPLVDKLLSGRTDNCYSSSKELSDFMLVYRRTYPKVGFRHVPK